MIVQAYQTTHHKPRFEISSTNPMQIGKYVITMVHKAKSVEFKLQLITLKKFKSRVDFDYKGKNFKIKTFTYVHHVEGCFDRSSDQNGGNWDELLLDHITTDHRS